MNFLPSCNEKSNMKNKSILYQIFKTEYKYITSCHPHIEVIIFRRVGTVDVMPVVTYHEPLVKNRVVGAEVRILLTQGIAHVVRL